MTDHQTHQTLKVAAAIMDAGDKDRWKLADAILLDAPASMPALEASRLMGTLCLEMEVAEIFKLDGSLYSAAYLGAQRGTVIAWTPPRRQAEASFETHAEQRSNPLGQEVLIALCAHARGERNVARPDGVDRLAWEDAKAKVATKKTSRYMVQANAVRIALKRRGKNSPTRLEGATFSELLHHLLAGVDGLRAFNRRAADEEVSDEDAARFVKVLDLLDEQSAMTRAALDMRHAVPADV